MKSLVHSKIWVLILASLAPFLWLLTQTSQIGGWLPAVANISGLVGGVLLLWQFALGNRFISRLLSVDYVAHIKAHIFLGSFGTIFALIHPVLTMFSYQESLAWLFTPDFESSFGQSVGAGRTAWFLLIVIFVSSAILRKKMSYRPWLYIHYLSYPMMAAVFLHAGSIGTFLNTFSWLAMYWQVLSIGFGVLVVWRVAAVLNLTKAKYRLVKKESVANEITEYTLQPLGKKLTPKAGQFMFIRFGLFAEAHPFTVMEIHDKTGELKFGIKTEGRATKAMAKAQENQVVSVDGPYGVFTKEGQNAAPKILIAGGIGITPFVELVKRYGNDQTYLFHCDRTMAESLESEVFEETLKDRFIKVLSREKNESEGVVCGRISSEVISDHIPQSVLESATVFLCGSPGFMFGVRKALAELGIQDNRIYAEEFSL